MVCMLSENLNSRGKRGQVGFLTRPHWSDWLASVTVLPMTEPSKQENWLRYSS